jgi:hypothetical protein
MKQRVKSTEESTLHCSHSKSSTIIYFIVGVVPIVRFQLCCINVGADMYGDIISFFF